MKNIATSILSLALGVALAGPAAGEEGPVTQAAPATLASNETPAAPAKKPYAVRIKAARYQAGATVPVSWEAPPGHAVTDWVGVFAAGAPDTQYLSWSYVPAGTAGALSLTAPAAPGVYEVRYLRDNGYTSVAGSARFSVLAPPQEGYSICRDLGAGDPYHPAWTHCCDSQDRTESYWIDDDSNGGWYSGSCHAWGVR